MKPWLVLLIGLFGCGLPSRSLAWDLFVMKNPDVEAGNAKLRQNDADAALEAYARAARTLPDAAGIQLNRGIALLHKSQLDEAEQALNLATQQKATPELRGDAFYNLGIAQTLKAQHALEQNSASAVPALEQAVASFKSALRAKPGDANSAWNLAYAQRELERAKELAENAKEQASQSEQEQSEQEEQNAESNAEQSETQAQSQQESTQRDDSEAQPEASSPKDQKDESTPSPSDESDSARQQNATQNQKPSQEDPAAQRERALMPQHVEQFLDALQQNEQSLQRYRAFQRRSRTRAPKKDW